MKTFNKKQTKQKHYLSDKREYLFQSNEDAHTYTLHTGYTGE